MERTGKNKTMKCHKSDSK